MRILLIIVALLMLTLSVALIVLGILVIVQAENAIEQNAAMSLFTLAMYGFIAFGCSASGAGIIGALRQQKEEPATPPPSGYAG